MKPFTELDENELLNLMQKGHEKTFPEIYRRYWKKLLAVGYYYMRDKEAAEEIVNDVLAELRVLQINIA